jgi:hypothetical protein
MKADPNCVHCGDLFSQHGLAHDCPMFISPNDSKQTAAAERAKVVDFLYHIANNEMSNVHEWEQQGALRDVAARIAALAHHEGGAS